MKEVTINIELKTVSTIIMEGQNNTKRQKHRVLCYTLSCLIQIKVIQLSSAHLSWSCNTPAPTHSLTGKHTAHASVTTATKSQRRTYACKMCRFATDMKSPCSKRFAVRWPTKQSWNLVTYSAYQGHLCGESSFSISIKSGPKVPILDGSKLITRSRPRKLANDHRRF